MRLLTFITFVVLRTSRKINNALFSPLIEIPNSHRRLSCYSGLEVTYVRPYNASYVLYLYAFFLLPLFRGYCLAKGLVRTFTLVRIIKILNYFFKYSEYNIILLQV